MEDYRQSEEYNQYLNHRGWKLEKIGSTNILVKKINWLGSVIRIQRGSPNIPLSVIDEIAKKNNSLAVAIEPNIKTEDTDYSKIFLKLTEAGYKTFNFFLSPTKTCYIDLKPDLEVILQKFDRSIHRDLVNHFDNNIKFKSAVKIDEIYSLLKETGKHSDYYVQSLDNWKEQWEPFGNQIQVILAYLNGELLGGNMITIKPPLSFGLFLPISKIGRANNAASLLVWEGIKIAKSKGCTTFDMNGLYDERFNAPIRWKGLSAFKKKFNGHEVEFMHPMIKVYSKFMKLFERLGLLWVFFVVK